MTKINELIDLWNTNKGKPYKCRLIDMGSYEEGNLGCMCAQGQVLHEVGGWTAEKLSRTPQTDADKATAQLLNISRTHAVLLRNTNDEIDGAPAIVLTDPAKVIGDQWSKLLDFWSYIDTLRADDWVGVGRAWVAAQTAAWAAAWAAAQTAAQTAAWVAAQTAARAASRDATRDAASRSSNEIQGAEIFKRDGTSFFFLPMFGFASPDDIPARPADYGVIA